MASATWTSTMGGNNYDSAMDKAVETALTKAGLIVEEAAILNVPVDSGRLEGSITWQTKKDGSEVRGEATAADKVSKPSRKWTVHIGSNVDYAPHIEYGTRHKAATPGGARATRMAARPYLRPALHNNKFRIVKEFGKWVEEYLRRGK